MAAKSFDVTSFFIRWAVALILVLATFNPTDFSYFNWVFVAAGGQLPLKVLGGIVLVIVYVIFIRATWRSIGPIGLALAAAFFAALIWVALDASLLSLDNRTALTWVLLVVAATILAIGISWSHVRRRVSGQADMDDVDE